MNARDMLIGIANAALTGLCAGGGEIESFWIPLGGDFEDPATDRTFDSSGTAGSSVERRWGKGFGG
jgi:hypothetical protein